MSQQQDIPTMAADIIKTMAANGQIKDAAQIPGLLESIGKQLAALANLGNPGATAPATAATASATSAPEASASQGAATEAPAAREILPVSETGQQPAVPIRESVQAEYIICLEDGKQLKMMKRHLKTAYNMTPDEYRAKWGLPSNYPMVAPNYAKQKSKYAKKVGLGTHRMREETNARRGATV